MTISFSQVPANLRVPFTAVEFNAANAQGGPSIMSLRGLIMGQRIAAGSLAANQLAKVTSADQVATLAGRGSQLHRMAKAWFRNNSMIETWIGTLDDAGGGVAASGTITITGPATAAGTLAVYIGGVLVTVGVSSGDAANTIAANLVTAVNAITDLPVTASAASAVVTLANRNKGLVGNSLDVRINFQDGDALPAGVGATVVAMASGTTAPVLTTLISAMGDTWFHIIAHPYTDATSLAALEAELLSRAGPLRSIDGLAVTSAVGTQGTLASLGQSRNSPYSAIVAQPAKNPLTPPEEFAAGVAAVAAYYLQQDPARPLQTLPVLGAVPPKLSDLFMFVERNLNLYDGIATSKVVGGQVQIERLITTYQTNAAGVPDTAYLDANTIFTLMYARYSFRAWMTSKYPRHKLGDDGAAVGAGQAILTPKGAKAEAIAWFAAIQDLGLVEDPDQFARDLVVERDASNPNRLNFLLPPNLINQLVVTAAQIAFRQ